jgi:hypothetical protein
MSDGRDEAYEIQPGQPAESLLAIEMVDDGDLDNPYFDLEPLGMVACPPPKVLKGWKEEPDSRLAYTYVLKGWEQGRCAVYRLAGLT